MSTDPTLFEARDDDLPAAAAEEARAALGDGLRASRALLRESRTLIALASCPRARRSPAND